MTIEEIAIIKIEHSLNPVKLGEFRTIYMLTRMTSNVKLQSSSF